VDSAFDSCLKDTGSNPTEAGHCVTTVGKLFTPSVPSEEKVTRGIAGISVAMLGKSFTRVGSGLLSLSSLMDKSSTGRYGPVKSRRRCLCRVVGR